MADQKISADTTVTPAGADFFPILQGGSNKKSTIASIPISTATQTALDAKQDTITGLTASGAELNILDGATLSTTELNYVDGVTSAIQTQLNAKQATLVSGTNIKTINGNTLLGSGDLVLSGTGDVVGPASSTDNALARMDGATGKLLQNSTVIVGDTGIITGVDTLNTIALNASGQSSFNNSTSDSVIIDGGITLTGASHRRINDGGSNELIKFPLTSVAGAVNEITISNAATGSGPSITATGSDPNIDLNLNTTGTGVVKVNGSAIGTGNALTSNPLSQFASTTSAQLAGVISDETGSGGVLVFSNSPALTTPSIAAITVSGGVLTLPTGASDTIVSKNSTDTLTNKSISLGTNTLTGTKAQFDTAVSDGNIAYTDVTTLSSLVSVGTITTGTWNATDIAVADGGTGRSTGTTAYSLIATGTTATGAQQTLANGATTEILVGGGASALPVWTTAQGSGAPVRATSPTLTTPNIGTPSAGTLTNCTGLPVAGITASTSTALGVGSIELGHASDTSIARVSAGVISVEGVTVPTISSTSTLTNKTLTAPVISSIVNTGTLTVPTYTATLATYATTTEASNATPTPALSASTHTHTVTALAAGATFGAPTGTPFDGQSLILRVKDNGTARTLAFNAIYRASTDLALPTTTVISKTLYMGFKYNSADSKWDLLSVLNNF